MFDPLAVMLVIAYNQALMDRTKRNQDEAPAGGSINIESASANNPNPYGDDDYATPVLDDEDFSVEEEIIEEPNEPREENDPTPTISRPTLKGGVKIQ